MKKNIWIFSHHSTPPEFGHFTRHHMFAKNLVKQGYAPVVFAGSVPHNSDIQLIQGNESSWSYIKNGYPFVFLKTCKYNGKKIKRIVAMLQYYFRIFLISKKMLKNGVEKPDVIIGSSVHPLACVAAIKISKKLKVPCICEIKDLWPESIIAYSNKFSDKNIIIKMLYRLEKWIYVNADSLIFSMEGGKQYVLDKKWNDVVDVNKIHHINNGIDLEVFDYNKQHYIIQDQDLEDEEFFKVIYTGSIRKVNNLGLLLDISQKVKNKRIKFLIWGDGNELEGLRTRVKTERIENVIFKGNVEKKYIPYILSKANLNLCHNNDCELFRYGISFNKIFDFMASGKKVVFDFEYDYKFIDEKQGGVYTKKDKLNEKLDELAESTEIEKEEIFIELRKLAEEYDFSNLTKKLINIIEE